MQKKSRLPLIAIASSLLLPYGFGVADTPGMITNQYWLFPLWTYIYVGNWLGFGVLIPPFLPSFSLLPPLLGLIWCGLGLYVSKVLRQYYDRQRDAKSVWLPTISMLILQIIVTIIVGFIVWEGFLLLVVPFPLHFLIVLILLRIQVRRVNQERVQSD